MTTTSGTVLDPAHAAFIMSPVVVTAASRDARNVPSVCIAAGRRIADDRRRITIFVCPARAGTLVADAAATGALAVVFCEPASNRTLQVKGFDAVVEPLADGDAALLAAYAEAMIPVYTAVDAPAAHARSVLGCPGGELVAISFTPAAAFVQTPGPRAGEPLQPGALPGAGL